MEPTRTEEPHEPNEGGGRSSDGEARPATTSASQKPPDGTPKPPADTETGADKQPGEPQQGPDANEAPRNTPHTKADEPVHRRRPATGAQKARRWFIAGIGLLLALVVIVWIFFSTKPDKKEAGEKSKTGAAGGHGKQGPAVITTGTTHTGDINVYDNALGTVTPVNTVTVYSQITGRVTAVYYRQGQIVHKGQPLIDIDPRPYEATLKQAEGTLLHDRGVLAEARMDLERYRAAYALNAIARQQVEDQEKTVIQDEGTVRADEGAVEYDRVQLSYCHIVAPITGRVGLRLVDPGNTVFSGTGSTLVVITQLQPITVVFNIAEDDLPQIEQQLKTHKSLHVDAFNRSDQKMLASGSLQAIDNQIDTTTGTLKFRADFNNQDLALFPNQFVNARLLVKTLRDVTLLPTPAIQHNGTAAFVYLVRPGANNATTVSIQGVSVLTGNETESAVTGVGPNTEIATRGFDRLESGTKVQVVKGKPQPAQTGSSIAGTSAGATTP